MDWKQIVGAVAPWIGTALGGPLGGAAVGAIADALGLSEKTEESIKQALSGVTPEQMIALKNADAAFSLQMKELGFKNQQEMARLDVENTKDARAMQLSSKSRVPALLAGIITVGFFGILVGLMAGWLKVDDNQALLILLGALAAAWANVVNYFFGSTANSQAKTDIIAKSAPPVK